MEENQNPTISVPETPNPIQPVIPDSIGNPKPLNSTPSKPTKKFPLKLIIGIIVFLFLAGGAAAGYVNRDKLVSLVSKPTPTPTIIPNLIRDPSPTPDQMTDWKTYTSPYGFSIKYPPNLQPTEPDEQTPLLVTFNELKKRDNKEPPPQQLYFDISIIDYSGSSAREFVSNSKNNYNFIKDIKIGNNEFIYVQEKDKPRTNTYLLQVRNGGIFKVSYLEGGLTPNLFDKTLTTLEFLDATHIDVPLEVSVDPAVIELTTERVKNDQELLLKISNISSFTSLDYELTYTVATGETRGATGSFSSITTGQNELSRNIVLGNCGDTSCIYDKGITDMKLTLKLWQKDGKIGKVEKNISD